MADEKEKKVTTASKKSEENKTAKAETKSSNKTESKKAEKKVAETKTAKTETKKTEAKATENKKSAKAEKTTTVKENKTETKNAKVSKKTAEAKTTAETEELVAKATVKYARISSRKIAIVANLIRGKNVDEAMAILKFTPKAGAEVLEKLLKSAIANAENNNQMNHSKLYIAEIYSNHSKLYIAEIYSNQGPTLKRIRPAAKGSAVRIRKRTSNTTIVLKERV